MFIAVKPHFTEMYTSAATIRTGLLRNPTLPYDSIQDDVFKILQHEGAFLKGMDSIVLQYDNEARERVAWLSKLEYALLLISIIVIVLEIIFIFKPTTMHVNQAMNNLIASEKNAQKLTKEIGALYASLEASYEKLSFVNQPAENPRLFAKADKG